MIKGVVSANLEATVKLSLIAGNGDRHQIEAVVDTGFNGLLMLPLSFLTSLQCTRLGRGRAILADGREKVFYFYGATIIWQGRPRRVEVDGSEHFALIGMKLLEGYNLEIDVINGGKLTIKRLAPARTRKKTKRR